MAYHEGADEGRYGSDKIVEDRSWVGYSNLLLESDAEPAILATCEGGSESAACGRTR